MTTATIHTIGRAAAIGALLLGLGACGRTIIPNYVVFFTNLSTDLDEPARAVVRDAANAARDTPSTYVVVAGYSDRAGSPEADTRISAARAQVVANELVRDGVAQGRIVLRPRGQAAGEPGLERRRVEITVGGVGG